MGVTNKACICETQRVPPLFWRGGSPCPWSAPFGVDPLVATVASLQVPRESGAYHGAGRRRRRSICQRRFGTGREHVNARILSAPRSGPVSWPHGGNLRGILPLYTLPLYMCPLRPPAFDFICVFAGQVYRNARVCYVAVDKSRRVRVSPFPQLWRGSELWAAFVIGPGDYHQWSGPLSGLIPGLTHL